MKTYYMHTLNGKPAEFDGDQIVFASFHGHPLKLCADLKQIRAEQHKSTEYRAKQGWTDHWKVSHQRVTPPTQG